jgi:uncharacterized membrane protein
MENPSNLISELLEKIDALVKKQEGFQKEVSELRNQLMLIQNNQVKAQVLSSPPISIKEAETKEVKQEIPQNIVDFFESYKKKQQPVIAKPAFVNAVTTKKSLDLEKFIGENLTNKIGIAVTIIGVAIGVNYSIEHDLISPIFRIILGYLVGAGLLGFGYKLKSKYLAFSAVLSSGAIAIFYFISFAAYDFYHLIPQLVAFIFMLLFTVIAVYTAIQYNFEVVAHIGLVGAYAVPFLLGDKSGNAFVLLVYTTFINIGILIIAFKKYWKNLNYSSFIVSWLIFASWKFGKYNPQSDLLVAFIFAIVFFLLFYLMLISYKLLRNEKFALADIGLLLANSFIFYAVSYSLLDSQILYSSFLGLFTIFNAVIHFYVATFVYKQKEADRNLYYLLIGLALTFLTIAIPVQLHGHWVTLSWVCESAILFWIGRTQKIDFYETMSYPVLLISFFGLLSIWNQGYNNYYIKDITQQVSPILNEFFLTSFIYILVIGFMTYTQLKNKKENFILQTVTTENGLAYVLPILLMVTIYFSLRLEISNYWNMLQIHMDATKKNIGKEYSETLITREFELFRGIWLSIYTMIFLFLLSLANIKKFRNYYLGWANMILDVWVLFFFVTVVCYNLNVLQDTLLHPVESLPFHQKGFTAFIRYISYASAFMLVYSLKKYLTQEFIYPSKLKLNIIFDIILNIFLFTIGSYQLVHLFYVYSNDPVLGKHCLSIMWGIYALVLIVIGISKQQKHLRVIAITLFSITLVKLFFYDTKGLGTIGKTVVFVSVGILLLIVSFLYNQFKSNLAKKSYVE